MIKHEGRKWILYSSDGSKKLGEHDTEEEAKKQENAINISKARAAGHRIPKADGVYRVDRGELSPPERLENGWLRADGYVARTGIQEYLRADGSMHRELRLADDVFHVDAIASFAMVPLTLDHPPPGLLDARNTRRYQVGSVEAPRRDAEKLRARLLVTDADAIAALDRGVRELSCGYVCDLDTTPGEYAGQRYDAIQRNIRGNHVALVERARGGPELRLRVDSLDLDVLGSSHSRLLDQPGIKKGSPVDPELKKALEAAAAEKARADLEQRRADAAAKDLERERARADAAEALTKKLQAEAAPEKIRAAVAARVALEGSAREVLGAEAKLDEASDLDVKRQVAENVLGVRLDGKSDAYVEASYDIAMVRHDTERAVGASAPAEEFHRAYGRADGSNDDVMAARARYIDEMKNAHLPKRERARLDALKRS